MLDLIKLEIKNCIKSKKFKISFMSLLGISLLAFLGLCSLVYKQNSLFILSTNKMSFIQENSTRSLFHILLLILPILASIIYSDSYIYERNENISTYFFIRTSKTKYFLAKIIVIFLLVFFSIFSTLLINELLVWLAIPNIGLNTGSLQEYAVSKYDNSFFLPNIYNSYPYLYNVIIISIISLFSSLIAVISFNISLLVRMKIITLHIFVFLAVKIAFFITPEQFSFEMYIQTAPGELKNFIITVLAWFFVAIITSCIGIWKECKH